MLSWSKWGFSKSWATSLPPHWPYDCSIDLFPGTSPPLGHLYSLSPPETAAMKKHINPSLNTGIIRSPHLQQGLVSFLWAKETSPYIPASIIEDRIKSWSKQVFLTFNFSSTFELLQDAKIFTKLDLLNVYHLVHIKEVDEWNMVFNTPNERYEYLVMPFGLTNTLAFFQALVNDVLWDMLNKFEFLCLDDILFFPLIWSPTRIMSSKLLGRLVDNQ